MSKSYTPGPWRWEWEGEGITAVPRLTAGGECLMEADVAGFIMGEPRIVLHGENAEANATLIASAPALVEALEEMVEAYWGLNDDKNGDGIDPPPACIIRARAALASAKGNTGETK